MNSRRAALCDGSARLLETVEPAAQPFGPGLACGLGAGAGRCLRVRAVGLGLLEGQPGGDDAAADVGRLVKANNAIHGEFSLVSGPGDEPGPGVVSALEADV